MRFKITRRILAPTSQYSLYVWIDDAWVILNNNYFFDSEKRARYAAACIAKYGYHEEPIGEFECDGTDAPTSPDTTGTITTTERTEK